MALRFLEGFEYIGALGMASSALQAELLKKWDEVYITNGSNHSQLADGWGGGLCLDWITSNSRYLRKHFDDRQEWWVGFAYYTPTDPLETSALVWFLSSDNWQSQLYLSAQTRKLRVARYNGLVDEGTMELKPGQWYYIEIYLKCGNSDGAFEVRVNGITDFSASNVDTQYDDGEYVSRVSFYGDNSSPKIDDIYIVDNDPTGVNTFLGPIKIEAIYPSSDDGPNDWDVEPTGVDHYESVDEKPGDGASYVYESTANEEDIWGYSDLVVVESGIRGIQINTQAALSEAGSETFSDKCKSGTSQDLSDAYTVEDTNYATKWRVLETDPDTGAAWAVAGVNAATFGVKRG